MAKPRLEVYERVCKVGEDLHVNVLPVDGPEGVLARVWVLYRRHPTARPETIPVYDGPLGQDEFVYTPRKKGLHTIVVVACHAADLHSPQNPPGPGAVAHHTIPVLVV